MPAVPVVAAKRPHRGVVAALRVAVAMLRGVGAGDARPALAVGGGVDVPGPGQPLQHGVFTIVQQTDGPHLGGVGGAGHDAKRLAYLGQAELAGRMELNHTGGKVALARLQVDAAGDTEQAHGVGRAGVGKAALGYGPHGGGEVGLARLVFKAEGVAPLVVAGGGFNLPCWGQRGRVALGADVVQHEERHGLAVGGGEGRASAEALRDKTACIGVPGGAGAVVLVGQVGVEVRLGRAVCVVEPRAVAVLLGRLFHQKNSFALGGD